MKTKVLWCVIAGSATSMGLFAIILGLLSFASTSVGLTAAYIWVAPALLLQARRPSEAASDTSVGPPDLATWIVCFLFWAVVGALLSLMVRRLGLLRKQSITGAI
jgi:predicted cobalt transporter CbtA